MAKKHHERSTDTVMNLLLAAIALSATLGPKSATASKFLPMHARGGVIAKQIGCYLGADGEFIPEYIPLADYKSPAEELKAVYKSMLEEPPVEEYSAHLSEKMAIIDTLPASDYAPPFKPVSKHSLRGSKKGR